MPKLRYLLLLALLPLGALAQPDSARVVFRLPLAQAGAVSVEPNGVLYVADTRQNVVQFAPTGVRLLTYSPATRGHLAALEATATGKVLAFYDDRQEIILFDRFLSPITTVQLSTVPAFADNGGLARAATLAPDGTIWLYDELALALVRLDARNPAATTRVPLDLVLKRNAASDIRALRVYQNKIYLLDRATGLYVFDLFGAYLRTITLPGLTDIDFQGDELLTLAPDGRALRLIPLYPTAAAAERLVALPAAPPGGRWLRAVAGPDNRVYVVGMAGITAVDAP